jgi:hypothetical protein
LHFHTSWHVRGDKSPSALLFHCTWDIHIALDLLPEEFAKILEISSGMARGVFTSCYCSNCCLSLVFPSMCVEKTLEMGGEAAYITGRLVTRLSVVIPSGSSGAIDKERDRLVGGILRVNCRLS